MSTRFRAFTVDHFREYTKRIRLDTGDWWQVEGFQLECVEPFFQGVTEVWAILPEGNAKTTLMAGFALYHSDYTPSPWVPIAASSRDQANILAKQGYGMIRMSPGMESRFKILEGYREIRSKRNGGTGIKVYAADEETADGVIPTLALCDEGHRWKNGLGLYRLWKGKLEKRGGQIGMISTSGEPEGEFEETRDRIREGARETIFVSGLPQVAGHVRSIGDGIVMNEFMVLDRTQVKNIKAVAAANPLSTITENVLEAAINSPTMDLGDWTRLKCNLPTRSSNSAVTEAEWDNAEFPLGIPEGVHIDLGVDVAWKHDTFAIVPEWCDGDIRLIGDPEILVPPRNGDTLNVEEVKTAFRVYLDNYMVDTAVMDMGRAEDIAAWLEHEHGVTVIDRTQGNIEAAEDYEQFMEGLRNGWLRHTGSRVLRRHVLNAIAVALPRGSRRFDRPSQSRAAKKQDVRVIDGLTAASMVNSFISGQKQVESTLAGQVEDYRIVSLGA